MAAITATQIQRSFFSLAGLTTCEPVLRELVAFAGVFIISLVIFTVLGYFIVKLLGSTGLTAADRILGFFFGIGLGGAIITVLVFLAGFTAISKHEWWHEAALIEPFQRVCVWGQRFLPEDIAVYHRYEAGPGGE